MSGDQRMTEDKFVAPPARGKARLLAIVTGMLGLVLAGCGTTAPPTLEGPVNLGDYQAAPRDLVQVESYSDSHPVRLGRGGSIDKTERARLTAYIADVAKNRPESLRVVLRGPASPAQLRQVGDLLVADGVDPRHIRADRRWSGPHAPHGAIIVAVERAIAVLPDCPGWINHVSAPEDNLTNPNFGCSDVTNFAAMVGDPHHLRQGASSIYADGEVAATMVNDYRTDKVADRWKDLPQMEKTGINPGGSK
jgi:pilus biogenesis lipoprotein CpaD